MSNTNILFIFSGIFCVIYGQQGPCEIPIEGGSGQCKSIFKCQSLLSIVNKANKTLQEKKLLKRSHCGIDNNEPAVCCPIQNEQPQCYTPEGKPGQCISVYSCPDMLKLLTPRPTSPEILQFARKSKCGTGQHTVCCGPIPKFGSMGREKCVLTAFPPEPNTGCCGVDSSFQNKIYGGNQTTIDQYPWLTMIEYDKNGTMALTGYGALISGKYVLTSVQSVNEEIYGKPVNIRLGEYDTSHEGPDCVAVEGGGKDCTEGAISIPIESIIRHPMYYSDFLNINDLALVRMSRMAPFTDFIRPICLPTVDVAQKTDPVYFIAAGWGKTNAKKLQSDIKLHVNLPYVNLNQCQLLYPRTAKFDTGHLCAGGVKGQDTCNGDSTLMYKNVKIYEYIGIVSFGPTKCGRENSPSVYTNVYNYKSWIKNTIVT